MSDLFQATCSVVIYSKRDRHIRLCKRKAARMLEFNGETLFAFCEWHRSRVRAVTGMSA